MDEFQTRSFSDIIYDLVSQILKNSGDRGSIEREFAYCFLLFVSHIEKSAIIVDSISVSFNFMNI